MGKVDGGNMVFIDEIEEPGLSSDGVRTALTGIVYSRHLAVIVMLLCHGWYPSVLMDQ